MGELRELRFLSAGQSCRGDLFLPDGDGPFATVVMAHGFGLTRDCGLAPFRDAFLAAGYATFLFDYRHFGESEGLPRQLLSPARQVDDWQAALHCLRGRPEVDSERLVLWGTSFSGGLVTVVAARETGIKAIIAQCPMMDGLASVLEVMRYAGPWQGLRLTLLGLADVARGLLGLEPLYIRSAGHPGEAAAMTSEDAWSGYTALMPANVPNRVAARVALILPLFRPLRVAGRVRCPALIQICENDSVAPPKAADRAAAAMFDARVRRYPVGHFDVYDGEARRRSIADQCAFLDAVLGTGAG